ncbi:MAG: hypothetical protein R2741_15465 [Methanolobus sp.]
MLIAGVTIIKNVKVDTITITTINFVLLDFKRLVNSKIYADEATTSKIERKGNPPDCQQVSHSQKREAIYQQEAYNPTIANANANLLYF